MAVATEARGAREPLLPAPWRVDAVQRESDEVVTLVLTPMAAAQPCAWQPGQFNMLYVFGIGEVPISVSGGNDERVLHTVRATGPVTRALCALAPGEVVGLRGPFGIPWPLEQARGGDVLIVAGGIGLAPLRPVLDAIGAARSAFGRVSLLYGCRSPADRLYVDALAVWREQAIGVETTVDHADAQWRGHVGVVTTLIRQSACQGPQTWAFVCGPEVMMRYCALELLQQGVGDDRIWVSLERNMHCATGHCGHCQLGPVFVCRDGAVFAWQRVRDLMAVRGL